jgi:hypothetical protein
MRRAVRKLEHRGVELVRSLAMFTRAEPFPDVERLLYLHKAQGIPRFWYDEPVRRAGDE